MESKRTAPGVRVRDLWEMVVGALALAYPVAAAEEAWNLGAQLSAWRIVTLELSSVIVIGFYVYHAYHKADAEAGAGTSWSLFLKRIGSIYLMTFLASAFILFVLDKLPLDDPKVALGRAVVVAFPASFAATIVDSLDVGSQG